MKAARATTKNHRHRDAVRLRHRHRRRNTPGSRDARRRSADITVFVGPWASQRSQDARSERTRRVARVQPRPGCRRRTSTRSRATGDLVLLKGHEQAGPPAAHHPGAHQCHRVLARRLRARFVLQRVPRSNQAFRPADRDERLIAVSRRPADVATSRPRSLDPREQVIVGLGNPEPRYAGTPHNIGYEVVDRLAASLGLTWNTTPDAWIARGSSQGTRSVPVKIRSSMNHIGAALKRLSASLSFDPEQCILVHDDLDTPIGSIRTRLSGGAGGHRGVASILEAFQTDAFRRVKVGVGQPEAKLDRVRICAQSIRSGEPRRRASRRSRRPTARALEIARPSCRGRAALARAS